MGSIAVATTWRQSNSSHSLPPSSNFEDILSNRRRSNDFRWASRIFQPSPYFHKGVRAREPKELVNLVLSSQRVRAAIRDVAAKEGRDEKDVAKQAQQTLLEMAHDYHLYTVRWFGYVLSKLAKNHFSSIFVNVSKLKQMKACFQKYPVILLPTHRSYVDFLLLSYVCFTYDLPLPVIAAGMDFMGMMGVAELLRKAGAFFIRRRFGNDSLYWSLISEYVKTAVLSGGHPMEMFIEGTRSRSGKTLFPKIGLLTSISELVRSREIPDILILPISMSYDRTLEETLYARELLGQPKPKESTNGLIKGLRWLQSQSYGSMYVNFGDFISIRETLGEYDPSPSSPYVDDGIFTKHVHRLGLETVFSQQRNLVTPLFSAAALVILGKISEGEKSMSLPTLLNHINGFRSLMLPKGQDFGLPLTGETLERNIRHILEVHSALVICPKNEEHLLHFQLGNEDEAVDSMKFQHYANQFIPLVTPYAIFSLLSKDSTAEIVAEGEILDNYVFLRELLFDDFIYDKGTEIEEITRAANVFNVFLTKGRINGHTKQWNQETDEIQKSLRRALEPFLISYWGVAKTLCQISTREEPEAVEFKQLGKMSQSYLRQLIGSHFPIHYGSLSLDTLGNAGMALIKLDYATKVRLSGGSFGIVAKNEERLSSLINRLEGFLPGRSQKLSKDTTLDPSQDYSQLLQLKAKL